METKTIRVKSCYGCRFAYRKKSVCTKINIESYNRDITTHLVAETIPKWCPLIKENITICLDQKVRKEMENKEIQISYTRVDYESIMFAIKSCRLSHNSSDKIDTVLYNDGNKLSLGDNDKSLLKRLIKKGDEECKFLRHIKLYCFIRAPRYWWLQFDTYKIGVNNSSQSTMHTIMKRELIQDDFVRNIGLILNRLNNFIRKKDFEMVKSLLPEGFMQTRGVDMNYMVLRNMYRQRNKHRLIEWKLFCEWIAQLPYSWMITGEYND